MNQRALTGTNKVDNNLATSDMTRDFDFWQDCPSHDLRPPDKKEEKAGCTHCTVLLKLF